MASESVSRALAGLFGSDEDEPLTDQEWRRIHLMADLELKADAMHRAAQLVENILERNEERLMLDDDGHLVIVGHLALYRVNLPSFFEKMSNPFAHHSFDMVEVHPRSGMKEKPEVACVQVQRQTSMPAYDLLAGYILGLMNDESQWLEESMAPLRHTLMRVYGMARSPLTPSLEAHLAESMDGVFDHLLGTFTFSGTNGWTWRVHYAQPLEKGFKIEYRKPRQTWWNTMFENHLTEASDHYAMGPFMQVVEHLHLCPNMLKTCSSWDTDPIFIRKVALDYPPVRRALLPHIEAEDYDPNMLYSYYDEPLSPKDARTVAALDDRLRELA